MSEYTAEQVERAAKFLESIRVYVDVGPYIPAMLRAYAAGLRERETTKGGVTDDVMERALTAFVAGANGVHGMDTELDDETRLVAVAGLRAALEAVWPVQMQVQEQRGEPEAYFLYRPGEADQYEKRILDKYRLSERDKADGWTEVPLYTHAERPLPESLKDPAYVHVMMLRGDIAVPSIRCMVDLRGEVPNGEDAQLARIAELQERLHAARPAVPDGWKLVPVEPTAAMLQAEDNAEPSPSLKDDPWAWVIEGWRAMLAAAPQSTQEPSHE